MAENSETSLLKVIQKIVDRQMKAFGLSDLKLGTVENENPLKIKLNDRITLEKSQILLTEFVLEKAIKLKHNHEAKTGVFVVKDKDESDPLNLVRGNTEDELSSYLIIQEGLHTGDKVIMISLEREQKYIVLSKLRDEQKVLIDAITGSWKWS